MLIWLYCSMGDEAKMWEFTGRTEGIPHAPVACIEYESTCGGIKAFPKIACKSASSKINEHLVWLGGLHYSYYTEPYKSDPNLMGFYKWGYRADDISVYENDVPGLKSHTELFFLTQEQSGVEYFWLFLVDIGGRKDIFRKVQLLLRVVSNTALTT